MATVRLGPIVERTYRDSQFQWAREVVKNAEEAGAECYPSDDGHGATARTALNSSSVHASARL
jgi:hypothetical protein